MKRIRVLLSSLVLIGGLGLARTAVAQNNSTSMRMPSGGMMKPMDPGHPCPATSAALPPELSGWTAATPVKAATRLGEPGMATIEPGHGVLATLSPVGSVTYAVTPGHPGEPGTTGGMLAFAIAKAGTYRVALGAGAWIDLVRNGQAVVSIAHGHGPTCSAIRKTVDFTLTPGRYLLEVSGNKTPTLALMIAPVMP